MDRRRRFEGCPLTRRGFMAGCAAGLGSLAFAAEEPQAKPRIRLVFTHVPASRPTWPNVGYDYEARKKELTARLRAACPGIEFLPATVMNRGQANKLLQQDKTQNIDGYLVYMLGLWTGAPQTIASASGKPTLFVDDLYGGSGEFLIAYAAARRRRWKAEGVSSSNFDDVAAAVRCFEILKKPGGSPEAFLAAVRKTRIERTKPSGDLACKEDKVETMPIGRCLEELKKKKILTVGGGWGMPRSGKAVEQVLGISSKNSTTPISRPTVSRPPSGPTAGSRPPRRSSSPAATRSSSRAQCTSGCSNSSSAMTPRPSPSTASVDSMVGT